MSLNDVSHWDSDTIKEGAVETIIPGDGPFLEVVSEVPVAKDGTKLPRRGNRYYPTMVRVSWGDQRPDGSDATHTLLHEDARKIGETLIRAADLAKATDDADSDTCGHWAPCPCHHPYQEEE